MRAITPEIEDEEEEDIEESIYQSESDCIIVASSRSKSNKRSWNSVRSPVLSDLRYIDVNAYVPRYPQSLYYNGVY
jgi:hypothetical protein